MNVGAIGLIDVDRAGNRALINAQSARLTLPGEARNGVHPGRCHRQRQFGAEHARLARSDAWGLAAHDAGLPHWVNVRGAFALLAGFGWRPSDGPRRARRHALAAPGTRREELPFSDGARRTLEDPECHVLPADTSPGSGAPLGGVADGLEEFAAKEFTAADGAFVRHPRMVPTARHHTGVTIEL
jgi:hypothetical protein